MFTKPTYSFIQNSRGSAPVSLIAGILLVLILFALSLRCIFILTEYEQAVVREFGQIRGEPKTTAGMHFMLPWQDVTIYDKRLLRWDGEPMTAITKDLKLVNVDITARWRIDDASLFLQRVGPVSGADARLQSYVQSALRIEMGRYDLFEVIRSSNQILNIDADVVTLAPELDVDEIEELDMRELAVLGSDVPTLATDAEGNFVAGRPFVMEGILRDARERLREEEDDGGLGIHLEDIMIRQLTYTTEIEETVYAQMNAALQKISAGLRSNGRRLAEERLGEMERELATVQSRALERVQAIRGRAEANATRIYAEAYEANPDFFLFLRQLESMEKLLGKNSRLVLSTESPLFRLLKDPHPVVDTGTWGTVPTGE